MANIFGHKYSLLVSKPPVIDKSNKTIGVDAESTLTVSDTSFQDFRTTNELDTVTLKDLHFTATVSGNIKGKVSNTKIDIYGVGSETLSYIKDNSYVILKGGYIQDLSLPVLFVGQVISSKVSDSDGISKVSLVCKDAVIPTSSVKVSKSWPIDTEYTTIIDDLADIYAENGLPRGRKFNQLDSLTSSVISIPLDQKKATGGLSVRGYLDTVLDDVCTSVGFINYVSSGKLEIEPDNYSQTSEQFTLKSEQIHTLYEKSDTKDGSSTNTVTSRKGYTVRCFLDGRMDIGKYVKLDTTTVKGLYKIINVRHSLSYEGDDWYTEIEVQNV